MTRQRVLPVMTALLMATAGVAADEDPPALERLDAPAAVEFGNRLLREENAPGALEAYRHAGQLEPDAAEIDFNEGLGLFQLEEFEAARQAFEKAATSKKTRLANDATYGAATTYHAEALRSLDNPQAAIEKLEHAIQRYQSLLVNEPDHDAARDAHFKAAATRRQLIQLLEQQQEQPQQQQRDPEEEQDHEQDQSECDQPQSEDQQDQSDDQEQQEENASQDEQQQDAESQEPQPSESEEQQSEEQSSSSEDATEDEQEQVQQEQTAEQEDVSREQAERRLREMMQAIRDREKQRHERVRQVPVAPTEKDW
jgi:Ca-activated chloride channel homolog